MALFVASIPFLLDRTGSESVQDHTIVSACETVGDDISFSGLLFIHLCKGQWKLDNPVST